MQVFNAFYIITNKGGLEMGIGLTIAMAGIASAVVLAGIGSSIGVGLAGKTSAGALSEDPENFGKFLILVALPGTQGIYGFVISFLAAMQLGIVGGELSNPTLHQGWQIFFACLPVAFAGLLSAIHQGKVCAAGILMTAKQPAEMGKALVLGVFVEFYALLGFVISFLLLSGIKI